MQFNQHAIHRRCDSIQRTVVEYQRGVATDRLRQFGFFDCRQTYAEALLRRGVDFNLIRCGSMVGRGED